MKHLKWINLLSWMLVVGVASAQVYNYFPPPGITYSQTAGMVLGSAPGGAKGTGTLNTQGLYVNGVSIGSGVSSANPGAKIGLFPVNGSAIPIMTSDSAPALSQSICPTWTHFHTFSLVRGTTSFTYSGLFTG